MDTHDIVTPELQQELIKSNAESFRMLTENLNKFRDAHDIEGRFINIILFDNGHILITGNMSDTLTMIACQMILDKFSQAKTQDLEFDFETPKGAHKQ